MQIFLGILIPFLGTTLGSAGVFFMRKSLGVSVQRALAGFAAGVMVAASIWSLIIPAIEQSENLGKLSFCYILTIDIQFIKSQTANRYLGFFRFKRYIKFFSYIWCIYIIFKIT